MGDGLLVYFGYPLAHEDDAERAVRSGLSIVDTVRKLKPSDRIELQVRIGIATGLVVAGDIVGEGASEEHAVLGDTPNLAARLQSIAAPGSVVISPSTQRLVAGRFEFESLPAQQLKGLSESVSPYRVVDVREEPSRFEAAHLGDLTPLKGRESELALLVQRWDRACSGEGQVVLVEGEPGIGKSRLIQALRDRVGPEASTVQRYQCSAYYNSRAFHPAIDLLERAAKFARGDDMDVKLDKLEASMEALLPGDETSVALMAALLSLPTERYAQLNMTPQKQRAKTIEGLVGQLAALSTQGPLLMLFEDVHWSDPSTLELLDALIDRIQSLPVLLLITYRPEFTPPWTGYGHVTVHSLNRLGRREVSGIVKIVTGGKTLPSEVFEQIIDKTDGVPLFVEELTKTVLEAGILTESEDSYFLNGPLLPLAIPSTLHDALISRLDRLSPVKEVAQIGACIGRAFSYELLAAVSPRQGDELEDALSELVNSGLIFRRGELPEATYTFKHALVRDAAYQSLLKSARRDDHRRIALALENDFPEVVRTQPELLAHHYTEGGVSERAVRYWRSAGEQAAGRSANVEAVSHFQKGLEMLSMLPESLERDKEELTLLICVGPAYAATSGYGSPQYANAYSRARILCDRIGEDSPRFPVVWGLWFAKNQTNQIAEACELADELLEIGRQQSDAGVLLEAHHSAWTSRFAGGTLSAVLEHVEQGKSLYDIDEHSGHALVYGGHDPGVCSRIIGGLTLCLLGYFDQARSWTAQGVALAEKLGHLPSLAIALSFETSAYYLQREPEVVQDRTNRLIALCAEHGFAVVEAMSKLLHGWALTTQGRSEEGLEQSRAGLDAVRATGIRRLSFQLNVLAEILYWTGRIDEALEVLEEALNVVSESGEVRWAPDIYRLKAELLMSPLREAWAEAENCFEQAIALSREQEAKLFELRAAKGLARLWRDQGKIAQARELIVPLCAWFTEGHESTDLKEARTLVDELNA